MYETPKKGFIPGIEDDDDDCVQEEETYGKEDEEENIGPVASPPT